MDDDNPDQLWESHPDGDDVAARYLGAVPHTSYWWVPDWMLIEREDIAPPGPGPGDECFMVGRYINHEDRQFDQPVVRFGNLAMLPEPVAQRGRGGFQQESFLVDMRSVAGFSGSPVTVFYERQDWRKEGAMLRVPHDFHMSGVVDKSWLLGVDWGHLSVSEDIIEDGKRKKVKVKSSMAAIVPAWKIAELLDIVEGIVKPREQAEAELRKATGKEPQMDAAEKPVSEEFDRFEDLTRKLVQTPKPRKTP